MGAYFFLIFVVIIIIIALIFVIINAAKLRTNKRENLKKVKKRFNIWLIILLSPMIYIGLVMIVSYTVANIVVPISNLKAAASDSANLKSVEILYWPVSNVSKSPYVDDAWFEMDGEIYSNFLNKMDDRDFLFVLDEKIFGEPVATIKNNPDDRNDRGALEVFFVDIMYAGLISNNNYSARIYPIANANDYEVYLVYSSGVKGLFCRNSEVDSVSEFYISYYKNYDNFDTRNIKCEYSAYTDDKEGGFWGNEKSGHPYKKVIADVVFEPGVFETLARMYYSDAEKISVEYPHYSEEIINDPPPGTNIFSTNERKMLSYSRDGIFYREFNLALIDGNVYLKTSSGGGKIGGYVVPDELNQYLIDTVFVDLR